MRIFVFAVLGAVLITATAPAEPRILNIPGDYLTIQAAIEAAVDTDIVQVAQGRYTERIDFSGKDITVTSLNPEDPCIVAATIIDGSNSGSVVMFDSGETAQAILTGFTICAGSGTYVGKDGSTSQYIGGGICCIFSSPTITHNIITENYGPVQMARDNPAIASYGGGIACIGGGPNINRNIIKNNSAFMGAGVVVAQGNARIVSNLIYQNSAVVAGGVSLLDGGGLIGNTLWANEAEQGGNLYAESGALISSNIITGAVNGGGVFVEPPTSEAFRYNNVFNNSPVDYLSAADLTGNNGNISVDPCFANAHAYDVHILPGSPCINAGQPDVAGVSDANDMDGQNRIYAMRIDIGADEYVGYVPPVANAGPDQTLEGIQPVTLDGSDSFFYDPNGIMEFHWEQIAGEPVTLNDPNAARPTFTPEAEGRYTFQLTVSDGLHTSEPDEVLVVIGDYVLVAFPGAEGAGRHATGGRSGSVYKVTNLNNSGPGSIVDALGQGNRTIIFDVSGTIELQGIILQPQSHTTIAGQTAPGDGICIKGRIYLGNVSDVVIRYLRVRVDEGGANSDGDAIDIHLGQNIIIDHVSASYARDEGISCREDSNNITVQWCIISEGLTFQGHSYGSLVRGQYGQQKTYHHNLYAHNHGRNPRPGNYLNAALDPEGLHFDFRNNVIYNWSGNAAGYNDDGSAVSRYNFIGNAYITGPESNNTGRGFRERTPTAYGYFQDNAYDDVVPFDPWSIVQFSNMTDEDIAAYQARSYLVPMEPVTTTSPAQAKIDVLAHAGASFPVRDIIDTRITNDVINRTGHSISDTSEQPEGAWPPLHSLPAPADSDNDGMPDYWELAVCLDPNDAGDPNGDLDNDGYTNIEEYINWLPTRDPLPGCDT